MAPIQTSLAFRMEAAGARQDQDQDQDQDQKVARQEVARRRDTCRTVEAEAEAADAAAIATVPKCPACRARD